MNYHYENLIRHVAQSVPAFRMWRVTVGKCYRTLEDKTPDEWFDSHEPILAIRTIERECYRRDVERGSGVPFGCGSRKEATEQGWEFCGVELMEDYLFVDHEYGLIASSHMLMQSETGDSCVTRVLVFSAPSDSTLDAKLYKAFVAELREESKRKIEMHADAVKARKAAKP